MSKDKVIELYRATHRYPDHATAEDMEEILAFAAALTEQRDMEIDRLRYEYRMLCVDTASDKQRIKELEKELSHMTMAEEALTVSPEVVDDLIESARLLGATEAKKGFGVYTEADSRFTCAMHEAISKHKAALGRIVPKKPMTNAEMHDMAFGYAPSGKISELEALIRAVESHHGIGSKP